MMDQYSIAFFRDVQYQHPPRDIYLLICISDQLVIFLSRAAMLETLKPQMLKFQLLKIAN